MEKIQFSCLQSRINPYPNAIPMAAPWYPSNHDGFISFMIKPTHPVRPPITRQKRESTLETKLSAMIMPFVVERLVVEEMVLISSLQQMVDQSNKNTDQTYSIPFG